MQSNASAATSATVVLTRTDGGLFTGRSTMGTRLEEFQRFRTAMNEKILARQDRQINRFFNLDTQCYQDGALPAPTTR